LIDDARSQLEIRPSGTRSKLPAFLSSIVAIAALFGTYHFGKSQAGVDWREAISGREDLELQLGQQRFELEQLRESLAFEQAKNRREAQVNRLAIEAVSEDLVAANQALAAVREELRFYESIVQDSEAAQGLHIHSFEVIPDTADGRYAFRLVVVNGKYGKKKVKGTARITIHDSDGEPLDLGDQAANGDNREMALDFKYFQRLEGKFALPPGFTPERVKVTIGLTGGKGKAQEKWYDWAPLIRNHAGIE